MAASGDTARALEELLARQSVHRVQTPRLSGDRETFVKRFAARRRNTRRFTAPIIPCTWRRFDGKTLF
jgi:hypothetical protein